MHPVVRARVRALPGLPAAEEPIRSRASAEAVIVLHRAARVLMDQLPLLTDRVVALLREQEPAYRAPTTDPDDLWQEVHRSLRHNVGSLLRPRESRESARQCSWRIGAERAEQGMPLDAVLHAFRLGGSVVWQGLVEAAGERNPDDAHLLVHVAADVWNFVDEHCGLVSDAYRQVERELTWRRENRHRLMTGALLDGTTRISDLPEVAAALGLPENGRYAVVVVTGGRRAAYGGGEPPSVPDGMRVVWHTGADADHGIVLLGDGGPAGLAARIKPPPGGRAGISSAVDGLAAVGDARRLAANALRCAAGDGDVAVLEEHLPSALVISSPDLGAALTDRVLGPVLQLEPSDRDIMLDTLTVWLAAEGSAVRAAARLFCHRNTVLNRLRRYEQLTGSSLASPQDVVELSLALTARRLLRG
ncbi:helix-turn-helix domain-containing protein [Streptomyces sp. F63]|uniref:PucR family transcriptional regulator n=1 Tax=Streptomyces sp. F63 TaxID=2824887 RepID=UPI001B35DAEE|nr:helix-turn-helix domain-containing protein [Streptomyces sp. F63]MBQ0984835.1 helix-turn-helix domain-containing protein [Streptomyces sp. F63]